MKALLYLLFFLILFSTKLFSCSGTKYEKFVKDEYYNFTDPDMVDLPRNNPLYKLSGTNSAHDTRFKHFANVKKEANIKEWIKYFKDALTSEDINATFYKNNSIEKSAKYYRSSSQYPHFGKYINFLHLQNKLAQNHEQNSSYEIINEGLELFDEEEKPFLKERYLYLLMRLYHHTGQYHKLLNLYANNVLIVNEQGIVKEWITSLRAGAYKQLKQNTKANQLYGEIFANHKTNPHYGYYDFNINSNKEWQNLLDSTDDNNTKALYYFLRAMKWGNAPLHELESIAKIAENSIWFERLSYMIMQDIQHVRHTITFHTGKQNKAFKAKRDNYKLQKTKFLEILSTLKKPTFFSLYSKLYLNILESNSLKSSDLLRLRQLANNKQKPYTKLLTYIYGLHQLPSHLVPEQVILYAQLESLLTEFSSIKKASILRYTILVISKLYDKNSVEEKLNKLFAKKQRSHKMILKALNNADALKFKNYIEKEKHTFFEKKVFKETMSHLKRGDVAKILATLYLQENNFKESQYYLRQVPKQNMFTPYNPFNTSIANSNRSKSKKTYSQREFVETMLRIKSTLEKKPKSAKDHFLYANGLYNKSWFGNFPMSSVLHRTPYLLKKHRLPKTTDLSEAKKEYELALKYSVKEEFRAKIAYQLLKIEFNDALSNMDEYSDDMSLMPRFDNQGNGTEDVIKLLRKSKNFSEAIQDFKIDYRHTEYAKEVIDKCITFRYF